MICHVADMNTEWKWYIRLVVNRVRILSVNLPQILRLVSAGDITASFVLTCWLVKGTWTLIMTHWNWDSKWDRQHFTRDAGTSSGKWDDYILKMDIYIKQNQYTNILKFLTIDIDLLYRYIHQLESTQAHHLSQINELKEASFGQSDILNWLESVMDCYL